jgi:hypothetical protein
MNKNKSVAERFLRGILYILWLIFTPIEIIFKFIFNFIKKLFVDTGKSIYSRLVNWFGLLGFLIVVYLLFQIIK